MKNKEIQEQRMKGYFIQATKEILKAEGLKAISVRNIADKAGYSYTTMYNYFNDINDLVFFCVEDFQEECKQFVFEKTAKLPQGIRKLKASAVAYASYFIEYPGIFDLFYLEKMSDYGQKQKTKDLIGNSFEEIITEDFNYCISHGILQPVNAASLKKQMKFTVIGMLLLYLNRHTPADFSEFIHQLEDHIYLFLAS